MNLFDMISLGNLESGDVIKLYKSKGQLPSGSLLKMQNDKALALKINEEENIVNITTVNTVVNGEEMFADMNKEQLEELIRVLMEMDKQLTNIETMKKGD